MVYPILGFQLNRFQNIYVLTHLCSLDIISITISDFTSDFILVFFSTRFSSYLFRLVSALSILCFDSSTLYLFDSSACYKQTFMLMQSLFYACFGYFKAF